MSTARSFLCGYKLAKKEEKGERLSFLLIENSSDKKPVIAACSAFGDVAKEARKLQNGDVVEAETVISSYIANGDFRTSFKVLGISRLNSEISGRNRTVFIDYKVLGLPNSFEKLDKVFFTLLEATPIKGKPPVKVECAAYGDMAEKMKKLKIRNGSRVEVSTTARSFQRNNGMQTSYQVTDISILADLEYASRKTHTESEE